MDSFKVLVDPFSFVWYGKMGLNMLHMLYCYEKNMIADDIHEYVLLPKKYDFLVYN